MMVMMSMFWPETPGSSSASLVTGGGAGGLLGPGLGVYFGVSLLLVWSCKFSATRVTCEGFLSCKKYRTVNTLLHQKCTFFSFNFPQENWIRGIYHETILWLSKCKIIFLWEKEIIQVDTYILQHLYFFPPPVWVLMCVVRWSDRENDLIHIRHWNGFWPANIYRHELGSVYNRLMAGAWCELLAHLCCYYRVFHNNRPKIIAYCSKINFMSII